MTPLRKEPRRLTTEEAAELFSDVVSLCCKVAHDDEVDGQVHVNDLVELRDLINDMRSAVAGGVGYKGFPKLVRE